MVIDNGGLPNRWQAIIVSMMACLTEAYARHSTSMSYLLLHRLNKLCSSFMKGSKLALRIPSWFCNCNSCLGAGRRDFKGDLLLWNCCYQFRCMSALIEYFVQPKWRWILVLMWNHVRKLVMLKWCCLRLWMCEISVLRVLCYTMHIIPYPDGVVIECLWSVDGVHYFHRPECTLRCHSDLMEWYWSGIGVA